MVIFRRRLVVEIPAPRECGCRALASWGGRQAAFRCRCRRVLVIGSHQPLAALTAFVRSSAKSSAASSPTDSRIMPSLMPTRRAGPRS